MAAGKSPPFARSVPNRSKASRSAKRSPTARASADDCSRNGNARPCRAADTKAKPKLPRMSPSRAVIPKTAQGQGFLQAGDCSGDFPLLQGQQSHIGQRGNLARAVAATAGSIQRLFGLFQ